MKATLSLVLALLFFTGTEAQVEKTINVPYTSGSSPTYQALLYLPSDYSSSSKSYPLLVFCHGTGEAADGGTAGTGLAKIYNSSGSGGPAYFIEHGGWPSSFTNPVTGAQEQFIVVSPQAADWDMSGDQLNYVVNYLVNTYRVDKNRIHLTGLSAGGMSVVEYVSQLDPNEDAPSSGTDKRFYSAATVVPMSQASNDPNQAWGNVAVANGTQCWGFGDPINDIHGDMTMDYVSVINNARSGFARFTTFNTGHGPWGPFYNPAYTENFTWKGVAANYSIYTWMLANPLNGAISAPPPPAAPVANAGSALTITLPTSTVTLTGSASTGTITSYSWTKQSGPSGGAISSPSSVTTTVTGLIQGTYVFKLTLNGGSTSTVQVTVNAAPVTPPPPVANAGSAQTITLPTSTVTLNGGASTGSITSYKWTKKTGPSSGTITSPASATTTVTGLVQGTYVFQLTLNGSISATVQVTVNAQAATTPPVTPAPPVSSASRFIDVRLYGGANPYNTAQWNNWNVNTQVYSNPFYYTDGTASGIYASLSINESVVDNGTSYGGSVAPPDVLRYTSYCEATRTLVVSGLKAGSVYSIDLYASRNSNSGNNTVFSVGNSSVSIATYDNLTNKATFSNLSPNGGQIIITISTPNSYNYVNGFVITETSGTSSASVQAVTATATASPLATLDSVATGGRGLSVFPNPVRDQFLLELNNGYTGSVKVTLTDQTGATKRSMLVSKDQQNTVIPVPAGDLAPGVYFITVQMGGARETRKILKL